MSDKIRTLLFTVAVTALFTLLVSGVNAVLHDRIELNRSVARQRVILGLFGLVPNDRQLSDSEIPNMFAEQIEPVKFANDNAFECYRRSNSSEDVFVFAFSGQGFWDNIIGFIAVDAGSLQIKGIEFTRHGETPGLGGRISEPEFKLRFKDKSFATKRPDGLFLRMVAEGSGTRADEIDGITGATGTSTALEKIINRSLAYFNSLKQGGSSN